MKLVATGHSDHPGHRERRERGKERGREKEGLLREGLLLLWVMCVMPYPVRLLQKSEEGLPSKGKARDSSTGGEGAWFQAPCGAGSGLDDRGYGFLHWLFP